MKKKVLLDKLNKELAEENIETIHDMDKFANRYLEDQGDLNFYDSFDGKDGGSWTYYSNITDDADPSGVVPYAFTWEYVNNVSWDDKDIDYDDFADLKIKNVEIEML